MYKESVKAQKKANVLIVAIVIFALAFMWIADMLVVRFGLLYRSLYQLFAIAIAAIGAYILVRSVLSEYEYVVDEDELRVNFKLGIKEEKIVSVRLSDIEAIYKKDKIEDKISCAEKYNAKKSFVSDNEYICIFVRGEKKCKLMFEPSDKMIEFLIKKGITVEK